MYLLYTYYIVRYVCTFSPYDINKMVGASKRVQDLTLRVIEWKAVGGGDGRKNEKRLSRLIKPLAAAVDQMTSGDLCE